MFLCVCGGGGGSLVERTQFPLGFEKERTATSAVETQTPVHTRGKQALAQVFGKVPHHSW